MKPQTINCLYGAQNDGIINQVSLIYSVILHLIQEGYTVLEVSTDSKTPRITVQNCQMAQLLENVTVLTQPLTDHKLIKKAALVKDCQIEWIETVSNTDLALVKEHKHVLKH